MGKIDAEFLRSLDRKDYISNLLYIEFNKEQLDLDFDVFVQESERYPFVVDFNVYKAGGKATHIEFVIQERIPTREFVSNQFQLLMEQSKAYDAWDFLIKCGFDTQYIVPVSDDWDVKIHMNDWIGRAFQFIKKFPSKSEESEQDG